MRRLLKRRQVAATEIQRVVRGKQTRGQVNEAAERIRFLRKIEVERLERLKRIRSQERELALLRMMPAAEFASFEKLRQASCARILQRMWRITRATAGKSRKDTLKQQKQSKKRLTTDLPKVKNPVDELVTSIVSDLEAVRRKTRPPLRSEVAYEVDVDAVGLSELLERVKARVQAKRESDQSLPAELIPKSTRSDGSQAAPGDARVSEHAPSGRGSGGGLRRKYQELFESRQKASVMLQNYHESFESHKRNQVCGTLLYIPSAVTINDWYFIAV